MVRFIERGKFVLSCDVLGVSMRERFDINENVNKNNYDNYNHHHQQPHNIQDHYH